MQRIEAYHILSKMWEDCTPEQAKAIDIAQNAIEYMDLMHDELVPKKNGLWEERPVNVGTCTTGLFCSECNFPSLGWRYNYCPNCGAKMNLEVTNGLDQH